MKFSLALRTQRKKLTKLKRDILMKTNRSQVLLLTVLCLMATASATNRAIPVPEPQLEHGQDAQTEPQRDSVRDSENGEIPQFRCLSAPNVGKPWKPTSYFKFKGCPTSRRTRVYLKDIMSPTGICFDYGEKMYKKLWASWNLRMNVFGCPLRCCTMSDKAIQIIGKYYGYRKCCQNDFLRCRRQRWNTSKFKRIKECCKLACIGCCKGLGPNMRLPGNKSFSSTQLLKRELLRACTYNYEKRLGHIPHLCDRCCDGILKHIPDKDWEFDTSLAATEACITSIQKAFNAHDATLHVPKRSCQLLDRRPDGNGGFVLFSEDRKKMEVDPLVLSLRFLYYCGDHPNDRLNLKELTYLLEAYRDHKSVCPRCCRDAERVDIQEILNYIHRNDWEKFRTSLPARIADGFEGTRSIFIGGKKPKVPSWCPGFIKKCFG